MPANYTMEEKYRNIVGKPIQSKSKLVNEAIIHYYDSKCAQVRITLQDDLAKMYKIRDSLQEQVAELEGLISELRTPPRRGIYALFCNFKLYMMSKIPGKFKSSRQELKNQKPHREQPKERGNKE